MQESKNNQEGGQKYFELNENENISHKNQWDITKTVHRGTPVVYQKRRKVPKLVTLASILTNQGEKRVN